MNDRNVVSATEKTGSTVTSTTNGGQEQIRKTDSVVSALIEQKVYCKKCNSEYTFEINDEPCGTEKQGYLKCPHCDTVLLYMKTSKRVSLKTKQVNAPSLPKCPKCGSPMVILKNKATGVEFIACIHYKDGICKTTLSAEQAHKLLFQQN